MMELLNHGLLISAVGMGLVFLLLAVLWGVIVVLLKLDRAPAQTPAGLIEPPLEEDVSPELAAAITVAVITHQAVRRKQAAPEMRTHWPGSLPSRWVGVGRSRQTRSWTPGQR
jgi:Na+-transporting methylmalonyl-CoA/oxaloacetate decarboxylase gamma subunit